VSPEGRLLHEVAVSAQDPSSLADPADVAVDARGSVLVLDRSAPSVLAYDKSGALIADHKLAPDLLDEARDPRASLLLDAFGRLWLLAPRERDLIRLDASLGRERPGRFLTPEDSVSVPAAAASLPNGETWIAESGAGTLRRFRSSGALAAPLQTADSMGVFGITALAADHAGFIYAADRAAQRILVFGPGGAPVLDRALGGAERKWRPGALAWSTLDRLAVADPERGEVQILTVERSTP